MSDDIFTQALANGAREILRREERLVRRDAHYIDVHPHIQTLLDAGLKRCDVAALLGVTVGHFSRIYNGRCQPGIHLGQLLVALARRTYDKTREGKLPIPLQYSAGRNPKRLRAFIDIMKKGTSNDHTVERQGTAMD